MKIEILFVILAFASSAWAGQPHIVVILADDLGYGDLGCYNTESKVPTPHLDRLSREGMRFTDAHSASTVCTPSRYSLMTGRMCFRTGYRGGVFTGAGGPSLIEKDRMTLPGMLRDQGYADKGRQARASSESRGQLQGTGSSEAHRLHQADYRWPSASRF